MEIAIVLSGHRHGEHVCDLNLRPFADSSLLEYAMDKLVRLDAPCERFVACQDKEVRDMAASSFGLRTVRASHIIRWQDPFQSPAQFGHLRSLRASWFLLVNPAFPLVEADTWWQVVEEFLASRPQGVVSATPVAGTLFSGSGTPVIDGREHYIQNEAFALISRQQLSAPAAGLHAEPSPYVLDSRVLHDVREISDLAALETRLAFRRLAPLG